MLSASIIDQMPVPRKPYRTPQRRHAKTAALEATVLIHCSYGVFCFPLTADAQKKRAH